MPAEVQLNAWVVQLAEAPLHRFADWPVPSVGNTAGVYAVWQLGSARPGEPQLRFLYVGMARQAPTTEELGAKKGRRGLAGRLASHASGRRSGDQFCIYVCDRLVLPMLQPADIAAVAAGTKSLDAETQKWIRQFLAFSVLGSSQWQRRDGA